MTPTPSTASLNRTVAERVKAARLRLERKRMMVACAWSDRRASDRDPSPEPHDMHLPVVSGEGEG
jgi:hypothetical protein